MGFWERKLGVEAPAQPRRSAPLAPTGLPPLPPQQQAFRQDIDPSAGVVPDVTQGIVGKENLADAIRQVGPRQKWAVATRTQTERCPKCNGDHYFTGLATVRTTAGVADVSQCYDCGYPVEQFGSEGGS